MAYVSFTAPERKSLTKIAFLLRALPSVLPMSQRHQVELVKAAYILESAVHSTNALSLRTKQANPVSGMQQANSERIQENERMRAELERAKRLAPAFAIGGGATLGVGLGALGGGTAALVYNLLRKDSPEQTKQKGTLPKNGRG